MAPIQIDFEHVLYAYKTIHENHKKHSYFQEILSRHSCFNEVKWKEAPKVRPKKFGAGLDMTDGSVFKKDLVSYLNKVSTSNLERISSKIVEMFKIEYINLFVTTLWDYFKLQPMFQSVYMQILKDVSATLTPDNVHVMNLIWKDIWYVHRKSEHWKISMELIEKSHNYDDFCDYIKQKKRLNATAEGFAMLITEGIVNDDEKYTWVSDVIDWCASLDMTNIVNKSATDSCIEQIREFCKADYTSVPPYIIEKLIKLNTEPLQKATYFKIKDFIEATTKISN